MTSRNSFSKGFEKVAKKYEIEDFVHPTIGGTSTKSVMNRVSKMSPEDKNKLKNELNRKLKNPADVDELDVFKVLDKHASTSWFHRAHKTMSTKNLANHSSTGLKAMKAAKGLK